MFTFSQLVDEMVSETKRPDLISEIARYVNQTVREVHFDPTRGGAIFYDDNFREAQVTATSDSTQTWEIESPTTFQKMAAVGFPNQWNRDGQAIWAVETTPGRHLNAIENYYYRSGNTFVFAGFGSPGSKINLGWYEFPRSLKYKQPAARPASYDPEEGWTYAAGVDTPELQEAARLVTTNWLLLRWSDIMAEGIRAKLYKRLSDTERARTSYSLYQSLRQGLWTSETAKLYQGG